MRHEDKHETTDWGLALGLIAGVTDAKQDLADVTLDLLRNGDDTAGSPVVDASVIASDLEMPALAA